MIKLYGPDTSRVMMCSWVMDELSVDYKHIQIELNDMKKPEFLEINPNGKAPAMVDGDLRLFESMAISLYLAKTYGAGRLWPDSFPDRAKTLQWTFWGVTELEPHLVTMFGQTLFTPPPQRDEKRLQEARAKANNALEILNNQLADSKYLLGKQFSISDLCLFCILAPACQLLKMDMEPFPQILRWQKAVSDRPHYQKMAATLVKFAEIIKNGPPRGAGAPPAAAAR